MKKIGFYALSLLLGAFAVGAQDFDLEKLTLRGSCGSRMLFKPGEKITFKLIVDFHNQQPDQDYFLRWTRRGDDGKIQQGKHKIFSGQPVIVTTALHQPGFVRVQAVVVNAQGKVLRNTGPEKRRLFFDGGAGVDIHRLQGVPEPADFAAFWQKQKNALQAPFKAQMTKVKSTAKLDFFAVKIPCPGTNPVTGYLSIPRQAHRGALPAQVNFQGYGIKVQRLSKGGPTDRIVFRVNAHGYLLEQSPEYYTKFFQSIRSNGKSYAFDPIQNSKPETAYFYGMARRVMRALQFIKTLPQWNGRDLITAGGSQGGLQAIWGGALDPAVTKIEVSVPWCCDLGGVTLGRMTGPWRLKYVPALNYFDPVHHAKRIRGTVKIRRAGLGDYVSPPSGIAIFYNNLPGKKSIVFVQGAKHGTNPRNPEKFFFEKN